MTMTFDQEKHEYRKDGLVVPNVTLILALSGLVDATWYTEEGRRRGQAVHVATQFIDEGDIDWSSIHPTVAPFVEAYQRFKAESGFKPRQVEQRVFNEVYLYAGTVDREGDLHGADVIVDIKTGDPAPWSALQTAAYAACYDTPHQRFALWLRNDGTYRLEQHSDRNDIRVFLAALALANWKRAH